MNSELENDDLDVWQRRLIAVWWLVSAPSQNKSVSGSFLSTVIIISH